MIVTELYDGQGLGNQLWCYVVTRLIAERNGYDFGIMSPHKFKGAEFMDIDFGKVVCGGDGPEGGPPHTLPDSILHYYKENLLRHPNGFDISRSDLELFKILDNTKVDGIMQSVRYLGNDIDRIVSWIRLRTLPKIEPLDDNVCIIHIRGGDFTGSLAMLDFKYYQNAMNYFIKINRNIKFYIVTDDVNTSNYILPNVEIIGSSITSTQDNLKASHHIGGAIGIDYNILNRAKNIIMSASSFGWWAVWTNNNNPNVIAPKYWAAYKQSDGYWSTGEIMVNAWKYLDIDNNII